MQLFISYTELLETKERRQSHLSRVYSFQCSCERCIGEDEVATGLLAAARDDIPAGVVKKTIREGFLRIDEDVNSKKKAHGQNSSQCCYVPLPILGACVHCMDGQTGEVSWTYVNIWSPGMKLCLAR